MEWNKMSEEFIWNVSKSFQRHDGHFFQLLYHVDTIIEKNDRHIEEIFCFVSIFLFCCPFFKIEISHVL